MDKLLNKEKKYGRLFIFSNTYNYGTGTIKNVTFTSNDDHTGYVYYFRVEQDYIFKFFTSNI